MRVLLNGMPLLNQRSGMGNYVYFLGEALRKMAPEHEWLFHYLAFQSSRVRKIPAVAVGKARRRFRRIPGMYVACREVQEIFFRLNTSRQKVDLYHETNYVPFLFRGPTVATVYDLSFLHYPETHPPERVRFFERYFFPRLARVNHFLTISESVKGEMVRHLRISPERITVTPLGLDPQFAPVPEDGVRSVTAQFGLRPGGYVISVGTIEPRKNIKGLLAAYATLPAGLRKRFPLVVVGGAGWLLDGWEDQLRRWGLEGDVLPLGFVSQDILPTLYCGARAMVYPSLYEGFGLPPLEAMGCGCPVLTSNLSSLPEVVGNAALMVCPTDADAMGKALRQILEDVNLEERLRREGLKRAREFRWEDCALKTIGAYEKALRCDIPPSPFAPAKM